MNRIIDYFKQYIGVISIVLAVCILLTYSLSYFKVNVDNKRAAEMYIGELKYSITIDGTNTNTLTVPSGETVIDVKVNNLNPVDTYYKLLYLKNSNITIKYYESTKDTNEVITSYNKPNDSITNSNSNIVKLLITNSSSSSQNVTLTMNGGYITNTLEDVTTPSTHSEITLVETPSKNTYFCKTNDTLTQGLKYTNGQYTYAYQQEGNYASSGLAWSYIYKNGWGVQLTDKVSTNDVNSKLCTYINNKPIVSTRWMFYNSQATTLDVSNFDTSKVTNMNNMFFRSQATTLDLGNFDTSNVTDMSYMFRENQAKVLDVSNFDTSKVTDMSSMFFGSQATTIDVSNFNTGNVTDMNNMFFYNYATTLDVSNFDTSKVTNMSYMFSNSQAKVLDVSNFDTSKVTNMESMFTGSKGTTLDVSNFDTSKVTNMSWMFTGSKATTLDLSNFDTSKVTNMSYMFRNSQATTLDLSNFDTSNVTDMSYMFNGSSNLKTIYVSNKFNTNSVTSSTDMFKNSTKLAGGVGTKYNSSYVDKTYARVDTASTPGYFTLKN